jgi:hypothetical protein
MRKLLKVAVWVLGVVLVLALGAIGVARVIAGQKYNKQWTTHNVSFPIPFPLSEAELEALRAERRVRESVGSRTLGHRGIHPEPTACG